MHASQYTFSNFQLDSNRADSSFKSKCGHQESEISLLYSLQNI